MGDEAQGADTGAHEGSAEASDGSAQSSDGSGQSVVDSAADNADRSSSSEPSSSDDGGDSEVNVKPSLEGDGPQQSTNTVDDNETHTAAERDAGDPTLESNEVEPNSGVELQATAQDVVRDETARADVEANDSRVSVQVIENPPDVHGNVTTDQAGDSLDTTSRVTGIAESTDPDESAPARAAADVSVVDRSDSALEAVAESDVEANASAYNAGAQLEADNSSAATVQPNPAEHDIDAVSASGSTVTEAEGALDQSDTQISAAAESLVEAKVSPHDAGANLEVDNSVTSSAGVAGHEIDLVSARGSTVTEAQGPLDQSDTQIGAAAESLVEADVSPHHAGANLALDTTTAVAANPGQSAQVDLGAAADATVEADVSPHYPGANLALDTTTAVAANPGQSAQVDLGAAADAVVEANVSPHRTGANVALDAPASGASPSVSVEPVLDAVTPLAGAVHWSDGVQVDVGGGTASSAVNAVGVDTWKPSSALIAGLVDATTAVESSAAGAGATGQTVATSATQSLKPRAGDLVGTITDVVGGFPVNPVGLPDVIGPASTTAPPSKAVGLAALNGNPRGSAVSSAAPAAPAAGTGVSGAGPNDHASAPWGAARLPGFRLRAPPHSAGIYPARAAVAASPPSGYAPFGADSPAGGSPIPGVPPAPVGASLGTSAGSLLSGGGGGGGSVQALAGDIAASLALALIGLLFASRITPRSHLHGPLVSPG